MVNGPIWQCFLAGSSKRLPGFWFFFNCHGYQIFIYVKSIATCAFTFFEYIISVIASLIYFTNLSESWSQKHFICSPLATNRGSMNKDPGYNGSIASSVTSPLLVNSLISCSSTINVTSDDTDENKYKRRSALTWFARYVCTLHKVIDH